jgi:hypothetical protein
VLKWRWCVVLVVCEVALLLVCHRSVEIVVVVQSYAVNTNSCLKKKKENSPSCCSSSPVIVVPAPILHVYPSHISTLEPGIVVIPAPILYV